MYGFLVIRPKSISIRIVHVYITFRLRIYCGLILNIIQFDSISNRNIIEMHTYRGDIKLKSI